MSAIDRSPPKLEAPLETLPEFELSYLYDNKSNPTEITIFTSDQDEKIATQWITINATATVPLDEIA